MRALERGGGGGGAGGTPDCSGNAESLFCQYSNNNLKLVLLVGWKIKKVQVLEMTHPFLFQLLFPPDGIFFPLLGLFPHVNQLLLLRLVKSE